MYQNPSDCPLVKETIEHYAVMKPQLIKMLVQKRQNELRAQRYQTGRYNALYAEWLSKDEKYCRSQKKMYRFLFFYTDVSIRKFPMWLL